MYKIKIRAEKEPIYISDDKGEKIQKMWIEYKETKEDNAITLETDFEEINTTISAIATITKIKDNKENKYQEKMKKIQEDYMAYRKEKLKNRSTWFFELLYEASTGKRPDRTLIETAKVLQDKWFKEQEQNGVHRIYPDPRIFKKLIKLNPSTKGKTMWHGYDIIRPNIIRILEMQLITDRKYEHLNLKD